jgi:hypothetical protein
MRSIDPLVLIIMGWSLFCSDLLSSPCLSFPISKGAESFSAGDEDDDDLFLLLTPCFPDLDF